jgi:hypothetical protein
MNAEKNSTCETCGHVNCICARIRLEAKDEAERVELEKATL